jgi:hypothetical protein
MTIASLARLVLFCATTLGRLAYLVPNPQRRNLVQVNEALPGRTPMTFAKPHKVRGWHEETLDAAWCRGRGCMIELGCD